MRYLKTNTATRVTVGPFFDKTDGVTPETALTVTSCKLTLMVDDGGVPTLVLDTNPTASGGNNDMVHVTNDDAGFYDLELTASNVNYVGRAMLAITDAATHCPVFHEFMILPAKVYDSLVGGSDNLEVDAVQWLGTACATPTVAGVPEVDITHIGGDAQSATDLKDFADAGYDPATNKVQGVVLTDTLTTYTGNTPQTGDCFAIVNHASYGNAQLVRSTTPANTLDVSATGEAGLDFNNIKDATGAHTLSNITVPTVTTLTGHTAQTGDCYARLGAPAGASVSADVAAVKSDTAAILLDTGTDGVLLAAKHRPGNQDGTAQGGTSSQITLAAGASSTDDIYLGQKISIYEGTGAGQTRGISSYNGTTKVCAVARNWTVAPDGTSKYRIEYDFGPRVNNSLDVKVADNGLDLTAIPWNAAWDAEVQSECTDALNAYDPPTKTEMDTAFTEIKGATWSSATDTLEALRDRGDSAWITATGFATSAALATAQADLDIITGADGVTLATSQGNYAPLKAATAMTESYAAKGATATVEQMLYMIWSALSEFAISGTTITAKKLDCSNTAMTFTLNDATNPTSRTRAS